MSLSNNFPDIRPSLNLDFANVKALDPRITFTRASTATYYDGKTVAKAEENLLTYSQTFASPWVKYFTTITVNSGTSPDGTNTAALYTTTGSGQYLRYSTSQLLNTTYTFSVYAKSGSLTWLSMRNIAVNNNSNAYAWFNLATGTIGTVQSALTATMVDAGNGWYRCSITGSTIGTITNNLVDIYTATADGLTVPGAGDIYIWGVQLEQRSSVTAYTPTTTQPVTNYVPVLQTAAANVARFDHDPATGESLGLLVEEQRTNLLPYGDHLGNINSGAGSIGGVVITNETMVRPDGSIGTVKKVTYPSSGDARFRVWVNGSYPVQSYVGSVYWKTESNQQWQRFSKGVGNTGTYLYLDINATNIVGYNETVYLAFGQIEAGAFPTSYIPTTASQVTRAADAASMTGTNFSSWYRADEGTFYAHFQGGRESQQGGYGRVIGIGPSGGNASAILMLATNNSTNSVTVWFGGIAGIASASGADYWGVGGKAATSYSVMSNITTIVGNGSAPGSTASYPPENTAAISIGGNLNISTNMLNGRIKRITYYPKRLSNENLQALTS